MLPETHYLSYEQTQSLVVGFLCTPKYRNHKIRIALLRMCNTFGKILKFAKAFTGLVLKGILFKPSVWVREKV